MARRETPDTGIQVDGGSAEVIARVRQYFEKVLGFAISTKPLREATCEIMPLEVLKLTGEREFFIAMVQKHGVAVAFPRKGVVPRNNNPNEEKQNESSKKTMIQGGLEGIKGVVSEFGKELGREIALAVKAEASKNKPSLTVNTR